jgi:hypothetical protein
VPKHLSNESAAVRLHVTARALRPPAIAVMVGCTAFAVEEAWRDGSLKYKLIGGARVSTTEQVEDWLGSIPEQSGKLGARGVHLAPTRGRAA